MAQLLYKKLISWELAQYRAKGPSKTTRMLVNALKTEAVQGLALLDLGGGVGTVPHQRIEAGVNQAIDVGASKAYLQAAREEANRRGIPERIHIQHGDFVEKAPQIPPADIVTLDREVCCFPDMDHLVGLSAGRVGRLYGLVYLRLGVQLLNDFFWLQRKPFRTLSIRRKRSMPSFPATA